jgi:lysozyme
MKIERSASLFLQIKRHEGLRLRTYRCPAGKLTIGYGHNLEANPVYGIQAGDKISQDMAEVILKDDVYRAARDLDAHFKWWRLLSEPRQAVLVNMTFQLGVGGLLGFKRFIAAIAKADYAEAAEEMLDSKWAKKDSPARARELADQMRFDAWQGV